MRQSQIIAALFVTLLVVFAYPSGEAKAQVTYDGCYVGTGSPVPSFPMPTINDIAMATIYNGSPVIVYNPTYLSMYTPLMRQFTYFHECAHHVRGHTLGMVHPLLVEQDADCWAIQNMVSRGLGQGQVQALQQELSTFGPGDWTHLPGPQRGINLYVCLGWN